MHEMSITRSMLEIVRSEMEKAGLKRLERLKIRVGELTAVEPDALKFCFEAATKDTPMEGAQLEIEEVPVSAKCSSCGHVFRVDAFNYKCPGCGSSSVERITGSELDIISIEGQ